MKTYCLLFLFVFTATGISGQTFYDHYNKGLKNQKKQNWEAAIINFQNAIELKEDDSERVRTYGVQFIDYFPNRELGITYYRLKDLDNARTCLDRSQRFQPSARAQEYLSKIDITPPEIRLSDPLLDENQVKAAVPNNTKQIDVSGTAYDASGISGIVINGETLNFSESGAFNSIILLQVGENPVSIEVTDLNQNTTNRMFVIEREESLNPQEMMITATTATSGSNPGITIYSPPLVDHPESNFVSNETKHIKINGIAENLNGIYEVLVNGSDAFLSSTGEFRATVFLKVGVNKITIQASDIQQNKSIKEFTVIREEIVTAKNELVDDGGKYYALVIGASEYHDHGIIDLDGLPTRDAEILANILVTNYTFEKEDVLLLRNPIRADILLAFDNLSNTLTDKDNLLIFYAGHGYYDEKTELGYWLPVDAKPNFTGNWIYNDVLVANLKRIQAKHTLLISDACFSGSIFKSRSFTNNAHLAYKKKYELASRKAITSGVLKTVPNKSVFFKYLSDHLHKNQEIYYSASQLFHGIEIPVANNSPNTPQYGDIQNVGDEGGDFIFIRR